MKVGTDGVLLGCWAPIAFNRQHSAVSILDVGTGSGLIALMLAQRCPKAQIDAIDIDSNAVEQAKENFTASVFSHQLSAFISSVQEWQIGHCPSYDLVVSNPPYFQNSLKNPDKGREMARHTDTLSYDELLEHSARLLITGGQLALILPAEEEKEIREKSARNSLYCTHITRVYSKKNKTARRVLMTFIHQHSTAPVVPEEDTLVLENETGGRSAAYSKLCEEFYL